MTAALVAGLGVVGLWVYRSWRGNAGGVTAAPSQASILSPSITAVARAISQAEGYGVAGAIPTVRNNPGDLTDITGSVRTFPSASDGWNALYAQLQKIVDGTSSYYTLDMSWRQMGQIWAGGDGNWAVNVAAILGVDQDSAVGDYLS